MQRYFDSLQSKIFDDLILHVHGKFAFEVKITRALIGIALGLAGAAVGTRLLRGILFGVTPLDPTTFLAVSLVFGLVSTLASYVPARRATKVDSLVALRCE